MTKERYVTTVKDTAINIVNSQIESIRNKNITRTSQRVYQNGLIGVAGTIGTFSESDLLNDAVDALNKKIEYPAVPSIGCASYDMRQPVLEVPSFIDEVRSLLEELKAGQPDFIFSNKISLTEVNANLSNDDGLNLDYSDRCVSAGIIFKEKASAGVFDGSIGFQERKYDRKQILDEFNLILDACQRKIPLPKNGRYPVIFLTEESPIDKFVSDLKADVFSKGGSLFSGKLGQRLFNKSFTFGQNLDPAACCCVPFFDAEGVVNPDFVFNLIEDGVIKAPYCDKKTACKYSFYPTGSAFASYDGIPRTSLLRPYIKLSMQTLKDLLAGRSGIVVLMASGGDFTPQGDYATPVQLALLLNEGQLIGRLPEFNLFSNIFDMFGEGYRGTCNTWLPFSTNNYTVLEMNVNAG